MKKKVLITGGTGQLGSNLCKFLLNKDYEVHITDRRKSVLNHKNIEDIKKNITIHESDLTDSNSITNIIRNNNFHSIYNTAAQSHVHTSFDQPTLTFEVNTIGVLNLLEAIKNCSPSTKLITCSTSEMWGNSPPPQNESTPFAPVSPYGAAKLASHWLIDIYRRSYNLKLASGISFNYESKERGINFVTQKIVQAVKDYKLCKEHGYELTRLELGNLDSKRDWSFVKDTLEAVYRVVNQDEYRKDYKDGDLFRDYCYGTGKAYTVREFLKKTLEAAYSCNFDEKFIFKGEGINEILLDKSDETVIMSINEKYYRPNELHYLCCDYTKIMMELDWKPQYGLDDIIKDMLFG